MNRGRQKINKRINITLPEGTVRLLDRVAAKGHRSQLINEAVEGYLRGLVRENLRKRLREGAVREAELDLRLTEDWFPLEEEVWERRRR